MEPGGESGQDIFMIPRFITADLAQGWLTSSPAGDGVKADRRPTPEDAPRLEATPWGQELLQHEMQQEHRQNGQGPVPETLRGRKG